MKFGDRLQVYKGIFGNKENPLKTRFKLARIFYDNDHCLNLYMGFKVDSLNTSNFLTGDVVRDTENPEVFSYLSESVARPSIFKKITIAGYFCDLLDDNVVCTLIKKDDVKVKDGCCNVRWIHPKELIKFRSNETVIDSRRR